MKILNIMFVAIVMMMLSACGGGGGGATPAAVTETYTGLEVATGDDAGVASVVGVGDDAEYTYNYQGTPVDVTLSGISAGTFYTSTEGAIAQHIGGTTYSYSRFGVVARNNSFSSSSIAPAIYIPEYEDGEVFYVGQKTSSMPTTGIATYLGHLTTLAGGEFYDVSVGFDVNYGDKIMRGGLTAPETGSVFGESILFDGTIVGSDFSGTVTASSWDNGGTFSGSFFGPNAEELGGVGTLSDTEDRTIGFSFGAEHQID